MITVHRFQKSEPIVVENEALLILQKCNFYIEVADSIALYTLLCEGRRLWKDNTTNETPKTLAKKLGWTLPKLRHNICTLQTLKIIKGEP